MKTRVAWIADPEEADSYSAREARILLRGLAREPEVTQLWFAASSQEPPHFWNGVRVFPVPDLSHEASGFLPGLINQQRPGVIIWALRQPAESPEQPAICGGAPRWLNRAQLGHKLPLIRGLGRAGIAAGNPDEVLASLRNLILSDARPHTSTDEANGTHLVMRQQLFCNASLSHVMFELTNALIELGLPVVAQDEHPALAKGFVHREEDVFRASAPHKYRRVAKSVNTAYDPESSITVHFSMLGRGMKCTRFGTFPSLGPREVLYATGNHTVLPDTVRQLAEVFEVILAPSLHVLRPYLEAGLPASRGAVIPHGIDPAIFSPDQPPLSYPTRKSFKFLQTSFPWVTEKGFDLTLKAFGRAFSSIDDVALVLRVPRIRSPKERAEKFGRLEKLVKDQLAEPHAPEILLVEADVPVSRRGGVYTGADCYVHPLRAEGFGMTILEAMACGLPVVATPWSGPADFLSPRLAYMLRHSAPVAERENGAITRFHVEPDLDHLVQLMRYVFEHRDESRALGLRAAATARRDWTWTHAARRLAAALRLGPARTEDAQHAPCRQSLVAG